MHARERETGVPVPVAGVVVVVHRPFPTRVLHLTGILIRSAQRAQEDARHGQLQQDVVGHLVIPVEGGAQATLEEAGVEAEVGDGSGLPLDVLVGDARSAHADVLRVAEVVAALSGQRFGESIVANFLITQLTPRATQLQRAQPVDVLQESLVAHHPCGRERGERSVAVVLRQTRRTVVTDVELSQVAVGVVVAHAAEERLQGILLGIACGRRILRAAVQLVDGVGGEALLRAVVYVVAVLLNGVTQQYAQLVVAELLVVREDVLVDPARLEPVVVGQRVLRAGGGNLLAFGIVVSLIARRVGHHAVGVELEGQRRRELQAVEDVDLAKHLTVEAVVVVVARAVVDVAQGVLERRLRDGAVAVVVGPVAVRELHGHRGTCEPRQVAHQTFARDACGGLIHALLRTREVQTQFYAAQLSIDIRAEVVALVAGVLHDTILVQILHREHVVHGLGTALHAQVVLLHEGRAEHLLRPVDAGEVVGVGAVLQLVEHVLRVGTSGLCLIKHQGPVVTTHEVGQHRGFLKSYGTRIGDLRAHFQSALGRDENHTISGTHTIDGGRSGILQHGDALDILGRQFRHLADGALDTVDENHRVVLRCIAQRSHTAHADFGIVVTGLCTVQLQHNAWQAALQQVRRVGNGQVAHFREVNGGHRTRQVGFLRCAVADDHHLIQGFHVFVEGDVERFAGTEVYFLRTEAHIRDVELAGVDAFQRELTVEIGHCAAVGAHDLDGGADDGLTVVVDHLSLHNSILLNSLHARRARKHRLRTTDEEG